MNMAVTIEPAPTKTSPIAGRLESWAMWLLRPVSAFPSSSIFQKIKEMQANAGVRADGLRYEIIKVGGDSIACPPDGGMWQAVARRGRELAEDIRCIETHVAVSNLPAELRLVVVRRWVRVSAREKKRSVSQVAVELGIPRQTVEDRIQRALEKLDRAIYGPVWVVSGENGIDVDP